MSTCVLLLRHGESADPTVFHGAESDIGLSAHGHRQAAAIAAVLAARAPAAVISSAMRRARETALPIAAACGVNLRTERDLHERKVGGLMGTSFHHTDGVWPQTLRRWIDGDTAYAPQGAESFDDIRGRVVPVLERLTTEYRDRTLVIVAHGVVCKVLLMTFVPGLGPKDWNHIGPIRNVAINELEGDGRTWKLVRLNQLPDEVKRL